MEGTFPKNEVAYLANNMNQAKEELNNLNAEMHRLREKLAQQERSFELLEQTFSDIAATAKEHDFDPSSSSFENELELCRRKSETVAYNIEEWGWIDSTEFWLSYWTVWIAILSLIPFALYTGANGVLALLLPVGIGFAFFLMRDILKPFVNNEYPIVRYRVMLSQSRRYKNAVSKKATLSAGMKQTKKAIHTMKHVKIPLAEILVMSHEKAMDAQRLK